MNIITDKDIVAILNKIGEESGTNAKLEILKNLKDTQYSSVLEDFFKLVFDEINYQYNISEKTVREIKPEPKDDIYTSIDMILTFMKESSEKGGFQTNDAKDSLVWFLGNVGEDAQELILMIIQRRMRCGISATQINKVWEGCIFIPPYMRCSILKEDSTILKTGGIVQPKLDGLFGNVIVTKDRVEVRSRQWGNLTNTTFSETSQEALLKLSDKFGEFVLHGEFLVNGLPIINENGLDNLLPREEGNGILNRKEDLPFDQIGFIAWDYISYENFMKGNETKPYHDRLETVKEVVEEIAGGVNVFVIDTQYFSHEQELVDAFTKEVTKGGEGLVVKNPNGTWNAGKTSKDQLKVKVTVDCELKLVGWDYGLGKYADKIGTLKLESSDGMLVVDVGSGLTDEQRSNIQYINEAVERGVIVTVRYNNVLESKSKDREGLKSLYLPRLIEFRTDKIEADSLEKITNQLTQIKLY